MNEDFNNKNLFNEDKDKRLNVIFEIDPEYKYEDELELSGELYNESQLKKRRNSRQ